MYNKKSKEREKKSVTEVGGIFMRNSKLQIHVGEYTFTYSALETLGKEKKRHYSNQKHQFEACIPQQKRL